MLLRRQGAARHRESLRPGSWRDHQGKAFSVITRLSPLHDYLSSRVRKVIVQVGERGYERLQGYISAASACVSELHWSSLM